MNKQTLKKLIDISGASVNEKLKVTLKGFESDNRNVRVYALRLLTQFTSHDSLSDDDFELAAQVVCAGLSDSKRRVRHIALKLSSPFLAHSNVVNRLREMSDDPGEKTKIRMGAVSVLAMARALGDASSVRAADLQKLRGFRHQLLLWLCQGPVNDNVKALLETFVEDGTREEAIMATRALCGYRIVNLGAFESSKRREITQTSHIAFGRVWYWVKRDEDSGSE